MTDLRTFDEDAADRFDERERARYEQERRWDDRARQVDGSLSPIEAHNVDAAVASGRERREVLICLWQHRQGRGEARPSVPDPSVEILATVQQWALEDAAGPAARPHREEFDWCRGSLDGGWAPFIGLGDHS